MVATKPLIDELLPFQEVQLRRPAELDDGIKTREVGARFAERRPNSIDDDEAWIHAAFSRVGSAGDSPALVGDSPSETGKASF